MGIKQRKALFFALDGIGGAERVMLTIAKILKEDGWDVSFQLIRVKNSNHKSLSFLIGKEFNYKVIIWDSQISLIKKFYRAIIESDASLIFSSAMHINQRLLLIRRLFKGRRFIVRNDNYLYTIPWIKRVTLSLTYRLADKIIAQTEEMRKELINIGLNRKKIIEIRNPLDVKLIKDKIKEDTPFSDEDKRIIFVACGRFSYQKGFDILVKAFSIVKKELNSECVLYILGDAKYGDNLELKKIENILEEANLKGSVVMTGPVDNPYKYMNYANVFVLSSRWEGLPNVLLEAIFLGIPSAATTCIPVIKRLIQTGINGFLAEPENPQSLAEAMIKSCKLERKKVGEVSDNSKEWLTIFNAE